MSILGDEQRRRIYDRHGLCAVLGVSRCCGGCYMSTAAESSILYALFACFTCRFCFNCCGTDTSASAVPQLVSRRAGDSKRRRSNRFLVRISSRRAQHDATRNNAPHRREAGEAKSARKAAQAAPTQRSRSKAGGGQKNAKRKSVCMLRHWRFVLQSGQLDVCRRRAAQTPRVSKRFRWRSPS